MNSSLNTVHLIGYGWEYESLDNGRFGLFGAPNKEGYVTVDYANRVFRIGAVRFGPANCLASDYEGRGWRKRLERDAQTHLAGILAS